MRCRLQVFSFGGLLSVRHSERMASRPTSKPFEPMGKDDITMPYQFTKEDARRGGIASGESRRAKRTLRETTERLLEMELPAKAKAELAEQGYEAETFMDALAAAVIDSARHGNAQQFSNLMRLLGEDVHKLAVQPQDSSIEAMEQWLAERSAEYNEAINN